MRTSYPSRRYLRARSLGDLSTVAATIKQIEGYYPGTPAYRDNNPGNLRPQGQPGCTPGADGFCSFPDYATGYQALLNQINLDASRGETIQEFINKYAPASDGNNPISYAASIANATGLSPSDQLSAAIAGSTSTGVDLSSGLDLSSVLPSFDLSSIDFSDPTTIAVTLGIGLALAWAFSGK